MHELLLIVRSRWRPTSFEQLVDWEERLLRVENLAWHLDALGGTFTGPGIRDTDLTPSRAPLLWSSLRPSRSGTTTRVIGVTQTIGSLTAVACYVLFWPTGGMLIAWAVTIVWIDPGLLTGHSVEQFQASVGDVWAAAPAIVAVGGAVAALGLRFFGQRVRDRARFRAAVNLDCRVAFAEMRPALKELSAALYRLGVQSEWDVERLLRSEIETISRGQFQLTVGGAVERRNDWYVPLPIRTWAAGDHELRAAAALDTLERLSNQLSNRGLELELFRIAGWRRRHRLSTQTDHVVWRAALEQAGQRRWNERFRASSALTRARRLFESEDGSQMQLDDPASRDAREYFQDAVGEARTVYRVVAFDLAEAVAEVAEMQHLILREARQRVLERAAG